MRRLARTVIAIAFVACGGGGKPVAAPSENGGSVVVADPPPSAAAPAPAATTATTPAAPPPASPAARVEEDPEAEVRASKAFLALVEKARWKIRDCHHEAIKGNAKLADARVMLMVIASFTRQGTYLSSATSPPLGDAFEACMKGVMAGWSVGPLTVDYSFQTTVILE